MSYVSGLKLLKLMPVFKRGNPKKNQKSKSNASQGQAQLHERR